MRIFDDIPRIDLDAKTHFEPGYRYLNRCARSPVARVRELLQDWADRYPDLVTPEWLGRFRLNDDQRYLGALFELYIRALLDAQGMKVEREPADESAKRIEFSDVDDHGPVFVIECRLALGPEFLRPQTILATACSGCLDCPGSATAGR